MSKVFQRNPAPFIAVVSVPIVLIISQRSDVPDFASGFMIGCLIVLSVFGIVRAVRQPS